MTDHELLAFRHPKHGDAVEVYYWDKIDSIKDGKAAQPNYKNGCAKTCSWFVRGSDKRWYPSNGDLRFKDLKPYNHVILDNPRNADLPRILTPGPKDTDALTALGFVASDHKTLCKEHAPWYRGKYVVLIRDKDAPSTATNGGGYSGHRQGKRTPGEIEVARAARILRGVARTIAVVEVPGGDGIKDPAQWCEVHPGTREQKAKILAELFDRALQHAKDRTSLVGCDRTEDGLAVAFAAAHAGELLYCHDAGQWFVWTGTHWRKETTKLAFCWARDICRKHNVEAKAALSRAATAAAVERFAQSDRSFVATSETWDRDTFLLGTPGGTVDLRTGELRPAEQEDYITRLTAVAPDFDAGHPLWTRFLDEATLGDRGFQRYLQQVAGYCLTGDTREHALFFVYGLGGNGKSVFLKVLAGVLADYATTSAMDTFTASYGDKHPGDLAALRGARLVSAVETEAGRAWAEARINALTGGETISARFMRQDFFEYIPQFKLLIIGNHKPVLRHVNDAAKRRFNIIPFLHKPPAPDKDLVERLRDEWPAILSWAIRGCRDRQENGLLRPEAVTDATAEYFNDQDLVRQWVAECCETGTRKADTCKTLYGSWTKYALASGEEPGTRKAFSETLQSMGYEAVKNTPGNHGQRGHRGIAVLPLDTSNQRQNRCDA